MPHPHPQPDRHPHTPHMYARVALAPRTRSRMHHQSDTETDSLGNSTRADGLWTAANTPKTSLLPPTQNFMSGARHMHAAGHDAPSHSTAHCEQHASMHVQCAAIMHMFVVATCLHLANIHNITSCFDMPAMQHARRSYSMHILSRSVMRDCTAMCSD